MAYRKGWACLIGGMLILEDCWRHERRQFKLQDSACPKMGFLFPKPQISQWDNSTKDIHPWASHTNSIRGLEGYRRVQHQASLVQLQPCLSSIYIVMSFDAFTLPSLSTWLQVHPSALGWGHDSASCQVRINIPPRGSRSMRRFSPPNNGPIGFPNWFSTGFSIIFWIPK